MIKQYRQDMEVRATLDIDSLPLIGLGGGAQVYLALTELSSLSGRHGRLPGEGEYSAFLVRKKERFLVNTDQMRTMGWLEKS